MKSPRFLGFLAAVVFLSACGVSEYTREVAERAHSLIEQRKNEIANSQKELAAFLASDQSIGFRNAAKTEEWEARLAAAAAKVAEAETLYNTEVKPSIEADDSSREYDLQTFSEKAVQLVEGARADSQFWRDRLAFLQEAKAKADQVRSQSQALVAQLDAQLKQLDARAVAAKREFSEQSRQIDGLLAPLKARGAAAKASLAKVEEQFKAHESGSGADYGVFGSEAQRVINLQREVVEGANNAEAKFAELSRSYAKTLIDMKAEHSLTVRRQSWDNSQEYPSLHDTDFVRSVDGPTFEFFGELNGSIATFSKGWFSDSLSFFPPVDQAQWDKLKIDPVENWPSDDDEAEIWLQDGKAEYFHKYHVVENGEVGETDWVPVDEAFFFANLDNLGMDVEAKPYGVFEENKLTHAAPPGMAYVGNERYGRWERQGGGMVWTWIAPYLFYRSLFGSPWQYSRNEWSTWRSGYYGSRPYYGSGSTPMYGTRSSRTQTAPRLSGSNFGRSGGFSRPSGSVRGAGPASRGGGFGGSGK